ncbi:uncharacterized protein LAESUDRAFT_811680 [Laetiporus sulphureus 93-53]|uniref:Uncharacterized protein n=1 Tax=Laetiporus sulphureus 93-53 TaxID=1314785 RepID=A0A165F295_9APHY|nr:uncharacterized protein LAESUDRAFT_811680 [Laetiporus sulphureus 93-53]KZT08221.1 hypothetical protein LAESUDRAFT_811680 [Laetiporus sulphureus 93-53]
MTSPCPEACIPCKRRIYDADDSAKLTSDGVEPEKNDSGAESPPNSAVVQVQEDTDLLSETPPKKARYMDGRDVEEPMEAPWKAERVAGGMGNHGSESLLALLFSLSPEKSPLRDAAPVSIEINLLEGCSGATTTRHLFSMPAALPTQPVEQHGHGTRVENDCTYAQYDSKQTVQAAHTVAHISSSQTMPDISTPPPVSIRTPFLVAPLAQSLHKANRLPIAMPAFNSAEYTEFIKCVSRVAQLRDGAKSVNANESNKLTGDGFNGQENRPPRRSSCGSVQGQNQPAGSIQATNPGAYYPSSHYASAVQSQLVMPHMAEVQLGSIRQHLGYDELPSVGHAAPQRTRLEQLLSASERALPMAVISDGPQPTAIFSKFQAVAQNGPLYVSFTPEPHVSPAGAFADRAPTAAQFGALLGRCAASDHEALVQLKHLAKNNEGLERINSLAVQVVEDAWAAFNDSVKERNDQLLQAELFAGWLNVHRDLLRMLEGLHKLKHLVAHKRVYGMGRIAHAMASSMIDRYTRQVSLYLSSDPVGQLSPSLPAIRPTTSSVSDLARQQAARESIVEVLGLFDSVLASSVTRYRRECKSAMQGEKMREREAVLGRGLDALVAHLRFADVRDGSMLFVDSRRAMLDWANSTGSHSQNSGAIVINENSN